MQFGTRCCNLDPPFYNKKRLWAFRSLLVCTLIQLRKLTFHLSIHTCSSRALFSTICFFLLYEIQRTLEHQMNYTFA